MTSSDGLTEWLLAQLDADEARFGPEPWTDPVGMTEEYAAVAINQVLADIAVKRKIIAFHVQRFDGRYPYCEWCEEWDRDGNPYSNRGDWPCDHLKLLALPFTDRPGYQEKWRPVA